jgi:endonuclease VIII
MPEGPEMRRAADELAAVLVGERAQHVWFKFPRLRRAGARLVGQRVVAAHARGKALLIDFESGVTIYTHNQLYGKWLLGAANTRPSTARDLRLAIETKRHSALLYSASDISIVATTQVERHPYVARLGVELLAPTTRVANVLRAVSDARFARRPLGVLLLDQGFLAGIGNYLRSEILFVAGLHPDTKTGELSTAAAKRLARVALAITRRAYRTAGVTNDAARVRDLKRAGLPYARYRHYVFDRPDAPCYTCGDTVRRIVHSGRQLYLCPTCQPRETVARATPRDRR